MSAHTIGDHAISRRRLSVSVPEEAQTAEWQSVGPPAHKKGDP